jgi:hypothetical protein
MGYMHNGAEKTTEADRPKYNVPATIPTYSISDLYMGTVNISYANPMADNSLKMDFPF